MSAKDSKNQKVARCSKQDMQEEPRYASLRGRLLALVLSDAYMSPSLARLTSTEWKRAVGQHTAIGWQRAAREFAGRGQLRCSRYHFFFFFALCIRMSPLTLSPLSSGAWRMGVP